MNIITHNFPATQYVKEVTVKKQIVLHHTVSGDNVDGDISWWRETPERVCAAFLIGRDGVIHQMFDEKYWAYHLGIPSKVFRQENVPYKLLDKYSIAIEIDSWGALLPGTDGKYYPVRWNGKRMVPRTDCKPAKYFYEYCPANKWRGFQYFEQYTDAQLIAVQELVRALCKKHNIPTNYNADMWSVSQRALRGVSGIFAHASYRYDKSDIHPQPEMVKLLKML